jgi:hypothetical protein
MLLAALFMVGGCAQDIDATGSYDGCKPTLSLVDTMKKFELSTPGGARELRYCTYGSVDSWEAYFDFRASRAEVDGFLGELKVAKASFKSYSYGQWVGPDHDVQWKLETGKQYQAASSSRQGQLCKILASVVVEGMTTAEPRVFIAADCFY